MKALIMPGSAETTWRLTIVKFELN